MMKHIFDVDIASKYGVNAAIIIENLAYWIKHNEANGTNFYDGSYWTYNSRKALKELFPYLSEKQISTAMKKLIDDGLVITGNYNKSAYDRTLWYALTEKGKRLFQSGNHQSDEKVVSILPKGKMEEEEMSNGSHRNVEPIPDINSDVTSVVNLVVNTNGNHLDKTPQAGTSRAMEKTDKRKSIDYLAIVNAYKETCVSLPTIRSLSEARKKAIRARLNSGYTQEDFIILFQKAQDSDFLKGKNDRNWNADFDWLIKDANMAKVLEGKYDNKKHNAPPVQESKGDDVMGWMDKFTL